MAGSLTNTAEVEILKMLTKQTSSLFPLTGLYLAMFTVAPTDTAAGTEAFGGGYARLSVAGLFAAPTAGTPSTVANNALIRIGPFLGAVAAGAPIVAVGLFNAATGGTLVWYCPLADTTKTYAAGNYFEFTAGNLIATSD